MRTAFILYDDTDSVIGFVAHEEVAIAYCQNDMASRYQSVEAFLKPLWPRPTDLNPKATYDCSSYCCSDHGVVDVYTLEAKFFEIELHVSSDGTIS